MMSLKGHILCRTCKLKLCLGKLERDEKGAAVGFYHGSISDENLGNVVLAFLAQHLKHDVMVSGDDIVDGMDLCDFDMLSTRDFNAHRTGSVSPIQFGGVNFWRIPYSDTVGMSETRSFQD